MSGRGQGEGVFCGYITGVSNARFHFRVGQVPATRCHDQYRSWHHSRHV
jgi:hypothetical protein